MSSHSKLHTVIAAMKRRCYILQCRNNKTRLQRWLLTMAMVMLIAAPPTALHAAQLDLADSPLFLDANVEPNIFFISDDSGSMDWDIISNDSTFNGILSLTAGGTTTDYYTYSMCDNGGSGDCNWGHLFSYDFIYGRIMPNEEAVAATSNMPADNHGVWRVRYNGYNKMYYNPDIYYKPWEGVDDAGTPQTFIDYDTLSEWQAVRLDPYDSGSTTVDLTSNIGWIAKDVPETSGGDVDITVSNYYPARYYTWSDTNTDNVVDSTDAHTRYEIRRSADGGCSPGATCPASFTRKGTRTDCGGNGDPSTTVTCTRDSEFRNFVHWFAYYRVREHSAKNAIGKVVGGETGVRMGYASIQNNNSVNTQIASMNGDVTTGNTKTLLDNVYNTRSSGGTPLRDNLDKVGKYYDCASGNLFGVSGSSCPILDAASGGACQQNFTILVTDGYWNGSDPSVGNTDSGGEKGTDPFDSAFDGGSYADGSNDIDDMLADVGMDYYERDLSSLPNDVPITAGVDNADHQHMVTYTVAFGVTGTLDPFDTKTPGDATDTDPTDAGFAWPTPVADGPTTIDDLWHTAYNGRGEFLRADNPAALEQSLSAAISSISNQTGSASAVAVNSRSLNTNTRLYQARFTSGEWSGDLRAIAIDSNGNVGAQVWSSKTQVALQNWNTGRAIITRNASQGIPFRWVTSGSDALTGSQQSSLNDDPTTVAVDNDGEGQARLNWLRGDASNEGTGNIYRVRTGGFKLGDSVNSSPIFVGPPPFQADVEAVPHSTFRNAHAARTQMVYMGGNDGMLHGFNESTGNEKFAYVPTMYSHFSNLNQLTDPAYSHRYYVDGTPVVADAFGNFSNGCSSTACWRTVLVGSMGGGGKGVFALDITDPDGTVISNLAFTEANAANISLWEFTDTTTPDDMGLTFGQPTIVRVKTGASSTAWAAIFANGYNSVNERAILYVVNIVTGAQIAKIDLSDGATGTGNGLSTPAVIDDDGDSVADYVYAGDLLGNMWKIDLTNNNTNNWDSYFKQGSNIHPLFKAVDGSSNPLPITSRPEVSDHPDGETGFMVYFGTGKYIENGDKTPSASPIQAFYGIWDEDAGGNTNSPKVDRVRLRAQTISVATPTVNGSSTRTVTNDRLGSAGTTGNPQGWGDSGSACGSASGNCMGWRVDLLTDKTSPLNSLGEMSISNPVLVGGTPARVIFTTLIPETAGSCNFGGTSWLMELNPIHGGQLNFDVFGCSCSDVTLIGINPDMGIMPEPVILRDPANSTDLKIMTGSTGAVQTLKNYVQKPPGGRQSWRQLR